jgi:plasmid stabilization system protein ParE
MKYAVGYTGRAERDLYAAYAYIARESPLNAERWLRQLESAIDSLAAFPRRCPVARETRRLGRKVHQLLLGSHRVLFDIRGRQVRILAIRHTARRDAASPDLGTGP